MDKLQKLKEVFIDPTLPEEEQQDNLDFIKKLEDSIIQNKQIDTWLKDPITVDIMATARESYIELSLSLINKRDITEKERLSIYARQDAMLWILSLLPKDTQETLNSIDARIEQILNETLQK